MKILPEGAELFHADVRTYRPTTCTYICVCVCVCLLVHYFLADRPLQAATKIFKT
jgi:hypothetical protein